MRRDDELWGRAQTQARRFLCRFEDAFTRAEREDLVQESTVAAWQSIGAVREPARLAAVVRTIARRKRYRALREHHRRREELAMPPQQVCEPPPTDFVVAGRPVPRDWLLARLTQALGRLREPDRQILLAHQEGFCCAEIAARLGMTEETVKVRMHRARQRVRSEIEDAVRVTAGIEGP